MDTTELRHYQEFKKLLSPYHISEEAKKNLEGLKLVLLVAATSAGRNTILKQYLLRKPDYYFIVSDTTRPPQLRDGRMEQNGAEYFFRSEEDMLTEIKNGELLEAALIHDQQVSGISIRELKKARELNKIAITDIEIVGANNIMQAYPDAKAIFLVPPSFKEWRRRIASKANMSEQEVKNRLTSAAKEFKAALEHNYYNFVIAVEDMNESSTVIDVIAHGGVNPHQDRGRSLVQQLYHRLTLRST
jgi:guanylate kinase